MSDLISRQAAIDIVDDVCSDNGYRENWYANIRLGLCELPSIEPEPNCSEIPNNWIPCSERLSEPYSPSDEGV